MKLQMTVAEVAALIEGRVEGSADRRVDALRSPEVAGPDDLAVIFRGRADGCRAGCLVLGEDTDATPGDGRSLIRVRDAEAALDLLAARGEPAAPEAGRHASALVADDAAVADDASLGPYCVVGAGAVVGPRSRLGPGVVLGPGARLGADCRLAAHVVVEHGCVLGDRVVVHANTVIGADGFGFRQQDGRHLKSPQVGIVQVGDDVEIGAHVTIDRARLEATVIGDGCILDDHVHVAHNCRLGEGCALAAQVGLAGGAVLGRGVLVGGQAGVASGVQVGDGAIVGSAAAALRDVPAGAYVMGTPARDHAAFKREVLSLKRLPAVIARQRSETRGS